VSIGAARGYTKAPTSTSEHANVIHDVDEGGESGVGSGVDEGIDDGEGEDDV
jgi:hypothetical protein